VFLDVDLSLLQKTSGVAARRSSRLPIEDRSRHGRILPAGEQDLSSGYNGKHVLTINEIFHSIQGESTHSGRPCVFVRLTACDLRCSWCDTTYAFTEGRKMTIDDILERVNAYECDLVEVTGGEPLLQRDVYPLMEQLLASGKTVMVETGGHLSIKDVPASVIRIVDVKCPGSGESAKNHWENLELLRPSDEVKFVIQDRVDYEFARDIVARHRLLERTAAVLFSPVHGVLPSKDLAAWILADRLPVRLQLQAHKYIWDAQTRGV
jgi:7-carboxy-7-deazaguanine synthase